MSADTRTPGDQRGLTAATIAEQLGVERRRLLQFVEFHPDPTASYVLGWARADPKHEDTVAAWLDARDDAPHADLSDADPVAQDDGRRGWLVR